MGKAHKLTRPTLGNCCKFCGVPLNKTTLRIEKLKGQFVVRRIIDFCSRSCYDKYRLGIRYEVRTCPVCGTQFNNKDKPKHQKFCSEECQTKDYNSRYYIRLKKAQWHQRPEYKQARSEYYQKHKEKIKAYHKLLYEQNKERILEKNRQRNKTPQYKQKRRENYYKNREKELQRCKKYRERNKEKIRKYQKEYRKRKEEKWTHRTKET